MSIADMTMSRIVVPSRAPIRVDTSSRNWNDCPRSPCSTPPSQLKYCTRNGWSRPKCASAAAIASGRRTAALDQEVDRIPRRDVERGEHQEGRRPATSWPPRRASGRRRASDTFHSVGHQSGSVHRPSSASSAAPEREHGLVVVGAADQLNSGGNSVGCDTGRNRQHRNPAHDVERQGQDRVEHRHVLAPRRGRSSRHHPLPGWPWSPIVGTQEGVVRLEQLPERAIELGLATETLGVRSPRRR